MAWNGEIYQGNHKTLQLTITGTTDDISGWTIYFTVKRNESDPDSEALIAKSTADAAEIKVTDGPNQQAEIYLLPDDTRELAAGTYSYDVKVVTDAGNEYTVVGPSDFTVSKAVKRTA